MTATYAPSYANLSGRVSAKSLDDRAGCYILLEVLKRCKSQNDLYFVFTVQEELGLRGAKTAAYELKPDLAIAVDVTDTGDVPGGTKMSIELGKGPAIKIKDNSVITHRKARDLLISSATENNIPYQLEILEAGGTDAGAIHTTGSGIVTGAVSIPCRYIHSNVETADGKDIENAIKLLNFTVEKEL